MKHYINPETNEIYAYESDGSQDHYIPASFRPISDSDLVVLRKEQADARLAAIPYGKKRAAEYPPMADYLDGIVKGDQAQIDKYIAECKAVKLKYPKP